jgi:Putative Ig domain
MNNQSSAAAVVVCFGVVFGMVGAAAPANAQGGAVISVPSGGDLQAAINAAAPGDTIQLAPGATYVGNFVLPKKTGTAFVTIRTAPDTRQPRDGVRVQPSHAPALARLRSGNADPAITTATGAHHYRLMLLEFAPNTDGFGEIVQLGQTDNTQTSLSQVPYSLRLDRLYIHGDPIVGQKRGIALNSASTEIVNCYISDIKAVGQDSQAIAAMNGPGPYLIENNYLEAAAENFMAGGVDPLIPNLIPSDITFRYNYLFKPLKWRDPIVPTPTNVAAVAGAGSLPAGTYAYRVVALRAASNSPTAQSAPSAEVSVTLTGTGGVTVSWSAVTKAVSYLVYGRLPGSATQFWTTTSTSFTDNGAAGSAGSPGAGTLWSVKNIFELKNARRVVVQGNVMEFNWKAAQPGFAIVLTPRNSQGTCTWCAVEDVTFQYNILRHTAAGVNVLGTDNGHPSGQARGLTFKDNLFYDVDTVWGGNGWAVQLGDGPADIIFDHNTIDHDGSSIVYAYGTKTILGFQWTNNLARHNNYGFFGTGGFAYGLPTITHFYPDGIVTGNVLAGGTASKYPPGNLFPTVASHVAQFTDPASGDYSLVAGSSYIGAGLDGKDLGANIAEIKNWTAVALSGNLTPNGVQITTTVLPRVTVGTSLAVTLEATGGSGKYTWSLQGALPAGVQFNATTATLSGVPTQYGDWPINVTAADAANSLNADTQAFTVSVWPTAVRITGASLPGQIVGRPATGAIYAAGGTGSYRWRIASGALPNGISISSSAGTLSGTPTVAGTFTFTVEVSDASYPSLLARGTFSITVTAPANEIVLYARNATVLTGTWQIMADASAAGGARVGQLDMGAAKVTSAAASPANYFELPFTPTAGTAYHLWIRGKAQNNSWANDSAFVQFSGSVTQSGAATYRIGTTSALIVNLEDDLNAGLSNWGWQDNGYGVNVLGSPIYFDGTPQKLRIQTREDGFSIDQIVLSPATYLTTAPGALKNDTTILPESAVPPVSLDLTEVLLHATSATAVAGTFRTIADGTAADGIAVGTVDAGLAKLTAPLAAPANYVEFTFQAQANTGYRLWMRGKAQNNSWANDSVFVQFSGSVDSGGIAVYRIGTTSATIVNLEDAANVGVSGWGWQDNGYGVNVLGPLVYFATGGTQRIRVQVREDGYVFDQIVLSSQKYLTVAPGALKNDTTILK